MRLYFSLIFENPVKEKKLTGAFDSIAFTSLKDGKRYNLDIAGWIDYSFCEESGLGNLSGRVKWDHSPEMFIFEEEGSTEFMDFPDNEVYRLISKGISDIEICAGYWATDDELTELEVKEYNLEFNFGDNSLTFTGVFPENKPLMPETINWAV